MLTSFLCRRTLVRGHSGVDPVGKLAHLWGKKNEYNFKKIEDSARKHARVREDTLNTSGCCTQIKVDVINQV